MIKTPRTEAERDAHPNAPADQRYRSMESIAQRLEIDLTAAQATIAGLRENAKTQGEYVGRVIEERNYAQRELAGLTEERGRLQRLVNAVKCTDAEGIFCEDIGGRNWFDLAISAQPAQGVKP